MSTLFAHTSILWRTYCFSFRNGRVFNSFTCKNWNIVFIRRRRVYCTTTQCLMASQPILRQLLLSHKTTYWRNRMENKNIIITSLFELNGICLFYFQMCIVYILFVMCFFELLMLFDFCMCILDLRICKHDLQMCTLNLCCRSIYLIWGFIYWIHWIVCSPFDAALDNPPWRKLICPLAATAPVTLYCFQVNFVMIAW